jgi:hypothetical protein
MYGQIFKSCTAGISDEQFRDLHCSGVTTFISFERLMKQTIGENLKPDERIKGMIIERDGIQIYLEKKK